MGSIRCYLEQLHFNLFDLRYITLFYKRTNIAAFPRPFPKKGAVYRLVFGKKRPNTSVRSSLLKSLLNKKSFPQKRKLLRENVFRPHNGQDNGRVRDSNGQFR
jgi:hypothetical protein